MKYLLLYTFPFEGNWNECLRCWQRQRCGLRLLYTFPFEGNGNPMRWLWNLAQLSLAIHFPVWRELKLFQGYYRLFSHRLAIHFPVWRELKLPVSLLSQACICNLAIHFPVWRELKHNFRYELFAGQLYLLYTFPFEGNWNRELQNCVQ